MAKIIVLGDNERMDSEAMVVKFRQRYALSLAQICYKFYYFRVNNLLNNNKMVHKAWIQPH